MRVLLAAKGLAKSFGAVVAAADLDLAVEAGEIHALIGPNGAGKTTVLRLLSGELRPDAGCVWLADREVTALAVHERARLGLARTFQHSSVLSSFSVLENVAVAIQAHAGSSFRFFKPASPDPVLSSQRWRSSNGSASKGSPIARRPPSLMENGVCSSSPWHSPAVRRCCCWMSRSPG